MQWKQLGRGTRVQIPLMLIGCIALLVLFNIMFHAKRSVAGNSLTYNTAQYYANKMPQCERLKPQLRWYWERPDHKKTFRWVGNSRRPPIEVALKKYGFIMLGHNRSVPLHDHEAMATLYPPYVNAIFGTSLADHILFLNDEERQQHYEGFLFQNAVAGAKTMANKISFVLNIRDWFTSKGCDWVTARVIPYTLLMNEYDDCMELFAVHQNMLETNKKSSWVVKPDDASMGQGIQVFHDTAFVKNINCRERPSLVVQQYLEPFLLKGRKFDLRAFMLIASTDPWIVFWHPAYARRSNIPYKKGAAFNKATQGMHLTNSHVATAATGAAWNADDHVWTYDQVAGEIAKHMGTSVSEAWAFMRKHMMWYMQILFLSHLQYLKRRKGSFHMIGVDFMLDEDMHWWLIEANACPGMNDYNKWQAGFHSHLAQELLSLTWQMQFGQIDMRTVHYGGIVTPKSKYHNFELVYNEQWGVPYVSPEDTPPCPCFTNAGDPECTNTPTASPVCGMVPGW
eukprot:TRINITY_DN67550_c4_g5_i1.p1 TRINITY_DN67550_c4_g5~~TRINITY_DN67550_c4_g5_i1.p1  ORF type:complete len:510 (-),score=29.46 TRINITY_DN67550_c4_g5_i1:265-1794(-)